MISLKSLAVQCMTKIAYHSYYVLIEEAIVSKWKHEWIVCLFQPAQASYKVLLHHQRFQYERIYTKIRTLPSKEGNKSIDAKLIYSINAMSLVFGISDVIHSFCLTLVNHIILRWTRTLQSRTSLTFI